MANRLADATSPYLLQHAENPVDWYPWGEEAFAEARRRDVPVLLSIGYAACHWCHVMARESFEDDGVAAYLNEHFVSIKVDREERPDVDAVYLAATMAMSGQSGWPMTVVLDHDAVPFYAGTYFPPTPQRGQPSFSQLLTGVRRAWAERRDEVGSTAGAVREHLDRQIQLQPAPMSGDLLAGAISTLIEEFDDEAAGFGAPGAWAPKFPPSVICEFLALHHGSTGSPDAHVMLTRTLQAMATGGLYDQLGGGFARYAVDRHWVVPHFEKMLYDNALLLGVYATWDTPLGRRIARETADFLLREMRTPQGGFASALDADSEGREGAYYVWTRAELIEVLGPDDGAWAAEVFTVTEQGTFDGGASVLQLRHPVGNGGEQQRLQRVRSTLLAAREQRERPARDDKVVTAWNGLTVTALCTAAHALEEPGYLDAALAAGNLLAHTHLVQGRLRRISRDGVAGPETGVAEDYGAVADAFVSLCEATGEPVWLERAGTVLDVALRHFRAEDGGFFDTADDAEQLITRPRELTDNAHPAGQSILARALLRYEAITGEHGEAASAALAALAPIASRAPRFAGHALATGELALSGPEAIAVVGRPGPGREVLAQAARRRRPAVVLVADADHGDRIPLLRQRGEVDGRPAAYVCHNQVCELPVTEPEKVLTG